MLGSPCLLFPISLMASREIDFVNDVHVALRARVEGPNILVLFMMAESFCHATFLVMNLNLSILVTGIALVGVGVGAVFICGTFGLLGDRYREKLWSCLCGQAAQQGGGSFSQVVTRKTSHMQWKGEPGEAVPGIHWPSSGLKYRGGQRTRAILVADQAHRYLSVFWFGVAGAAAFALLPPVVAGLYSVYMGALFLFQQEGLRIYPKSPRLYHLLDLAFKGGALFMAVCHSKLLFLSCQATQIVFIALVAWDALYSLSLLVFGEQALSVGFYKM